jgi:hypothetical protein
MSRRSISLALTALLGAGALMIGTAGCGDSSTPAATPATTTAVETVTAAPAATTAPAPATTVTVDAVGTRPVVNHDLFTEFFRQSVANGARKNIARTTSGRRHDKADWTRRIGRHGGRLCQRTDSVQAQNHEHDATR